MHFQINLNLKFDSLPNLYFQDIIQVPMFNLFSSFFIYLVCVCKLKIFFEILFTFKKKKVKRREECLEKNNFKSN